MSWMKAAGLILLMMSGLAACSARGIPVKSAKSICSLVCEKPHKPVKVINNTITGEYITNAEDNHVDDHDCIECLEETGGGK